MGRFYSYGFVIVSAKESADQFIKLTQITRYKNDGLFVVENGMSR